MKINKKISNLIQKIQATGLFVDYDELDNGKHPYISIYKKNPNKCVLEICFDKKGNMTDIVVGKKETKAHWINIQQHNESKPKKK